MMVYETSAGHGREFTIEQKKSKNILGNKVYDFEIDYLNF